MAAEKPEKFDAPVEVTVTSGGKPVPVGVTTGTQGSRVVSPGPGPSSEPRVATQPAKDAERARVQKLPVSKDGSVPALEGHKTEHRRVEDGEGSPRWRVEDGEVPPGFVTSVPPERGLDP